MDIFIAEFKRQFTIKRLISYVGLAIVLAIFWSWFIIGATKIGFLGKDSYEGLQGIEAIEASNKDRNAYSGKMTEDLFEQSGQIFLNSLGDDGEVIMNDELLQYVVYADTLLTQELKTKEMTRESLNFENFSDDFGYSFYEKENLYYDNLIKGMTDNQAEEDLAQREWQKVEQLYTYYASFGIWVEAVEHIQLLSFVLLIMIALFSSGIMVKDKESGLDEIISTTRGGRRSILVAKVSIPILMSTLVYIIGIGLYIGILKYILPVNALETSAQLWGASILPYNLGEIMQIMIGFGLLGAITVSAFSTFISSKSNKFSIAMIITSLVVILSFVLSSMIDLSNPILKWLSFFVPGSLVFSYSDLVGIPIVSFLGKAMLNFKLSFFISIAIFILSLSVASWRYLRR